MSLEILGAGFDIHGGGDDLVFPHHENEIAQAEGAGHEFAHYWLHSGMVTIAGEKMSKSLGNFTTLREALDAHGPRAFRWLVVRTHYRRQMEINDDALRAAGKEIEGFDALVRRARGVALATVDASALDEFRDAMDDDFDTPSAVAVIHGWRRDANAAIDDGRLDDAAAHLADVRAALAVLGVELVDTKPESGAPINANDSAVDDAVAARVAARARKDFAEADRLRDELRSQGVELEDTPQGTIWRRV